MTDAEIADSCTIPPRGHGVVLNAKVRNEEAMRVVHEILCTFGAPPTEKDQNSADHTCRLVSIGISNARLTRDLRECPKQAPIYRAPIVCVNSLTKSAPDARRQMCPLDSETVCPQQGRTRYSKSVRNK